LNPQEFVIKWRNVQLKERSAAQEHFLDLCRLINHPTPAEYDPGGEKFSFEAGVSKQGGGHGFADVWKKGFFAWEYKGRHADLDKAYQQLLQYRESLQNPPLLVVSDMEQIVIHTNFTNTVKRVETLTLDDLLRPEGMATLKVIFYEPEKLRAVKTTDQVTREAAGEFAKLADLLRGYGEDPHRAAHFLIRLLFCLFAEDIGLLPKDIFTRLVNQTRNDAKAFTALLTQLFQAMATGGWLGVEKIIHFDGGLFDEDDLVLGLDSDGMRVLAKIAGFDWSSIEPSILGTLFERSLDPAKRSQLGAHYTSREDILLIVEPVLMQPLRRRWEEVKVQAEARVEKLGQTKDRGARTRARKALTALLMSFADEIAQVKVLDPACGSGNFLYVALKQLLDLEKEVINYAAEIGVGSFFPTVSPEQLYGIELNPYAHELAQTTVWIGYIQWLRDNGFGHPSEPILKPIQNIVQMDAILAYDEDGNPVGPDWPQADVVIGNPPFLGGKRMLGILGESYISTLFDLYKERVDSRSDLVGYWFERARKYISQGRLKRAGLLATQNIRSGLNRGVLERITETGQIFMAWSDREWVLDGADVRVSMIGFDNGDEKQIRLDGKSVHKIFANLTSTVDVTKAQPLLENQNICLRTDEKGGAFDISDHLAQEMLSAPINVNGRPNSDVVIPWMSGVDVVRRPRNRWIIDFGTDASLEQASQYEMPFRHIEKVVKPQRERNRITRLREQWWIHRGPGRAMRKAWSRLKRYIVTLRVAKHLIFTFLDKKYLPDVLWFSLTGRPKKVDKGGII